MCLKCELKDGCPDSPLQTLQVTLITEQVPINWIALLFIVAQWYFISQLLATDLENREMFEFFKIIIITIIDHHEHEVTDRMSW